MTLYRIKKESNARFYPNFCVKRVSKRFWHRNLWQLPIIDYEKHYLLLDGKPTVLTTIVYTIGEDAKTSRTLKYLVKNGRSVMLKSSMSSTDAVSGAYYGVFLVENVILTLPLSIMELVENCDE